MSWFHADVWAQTWTMCLTDDLTSGAPAVAALLQRSQGGGGINTAYIERLNATFRRRPACLARRTRHLVQEQATLTSGMYVVGCFYDFCDEHESLCLRLGLTKGGHHWVQGTPASDYQDY